MDELKSQKVSIIEAYEKLVFKDILDAAKCFDGVYKTSNGEDGYVSIEISPQYAYDTLRTTVEAKRTFTALARPNIMIKIPATKEGFPAIKEVIASGINVNATLIFSVEQYEKTANAYIEGLQKRASEGRNLSNIHSVASVFISRVDTVIDKALDEKDSKPLRGLAAVANAKIIYEKFKEIFYSERFEKLKKQGANVQRPLWASTSSKNPAYSKVKYVEELIGSETVNTMPEETVKAFLQSGNIKVVVEENLEDAKKTIKSLNEEGINIDLVCKKLQAEGVKKFVESFELLLDSISKSIL